MPASTNKKVRLRAPPGTDEANHGTERYRVDNDGIIEVPQEAAGALESVGGFTEIVAPVDLPAGTVRVVHDDEKATCSFRGASFEPEEDGSLVVPMIAVGELAAHGFKPVAAEG